MLRLKGFFAVFFVLVLAGALWTKDSIWAADIPPTRLGLANIDPDAAKRVQHAFKVMSERVRAAYPEGAQSSIFSEAPPFDAASWLQNYADASLAGDMPRLSNLHARLQQAALVLSQRDLVSLSTALVKAASLASRELDDDKTALRQFTGYLFMAFIPVFDHTKRVDETLQAWLLDNRQLVGDLPSLFLHKSGRVVYYPLRGADCPLCLHDAELIVDSLIGLATDTYGGVTVPLLGNKDCPFSEAIDKGYFPGLGAACQRSQCMPSKDPKLNPAARIKTDRHPVSSLFGGGDGEDCEEADQSDEENCGIDLNTTSDKTRFFNCNFGAILGLKNERWNFVNTTGALPCTDPRAEEGEGSSEPAPCEEGDEDCEEEDGGDTWDHDGNGDVTHDEVERTLDEAVREALELWNDPNFKKQVCAQVCERLGVTSEEFISAVDTIVGLVQEGVIEYSFAATQEVDNIKDPDSVYYGIVDFSYDSFEQILDESTLFLFFYGSMREDGVDPTAVAAQLLGELVFHQALLSGDMALWLMEQEDDTLFGFTQEVLKRSGIFISPRYRQCSPDDPDCGNSCSAVTQFMKEVGSCLESAFGQGREDPGLAPWIQPVLDRTAMRPACFGPSEEKQCAAVMCADGSAAQVCSFGRGCCCHVPQVDPDALPDTEPLPGCPPGIDPFVMCVPEL